VPGVRAGSARAAARRARVRPLARRVVVVRLRRKLPTRTSSALPMSASLLKMT